MTTRARSTRSSGARSGATKSDHRSNGWRDRLAVLRHIPSLLVMVYHTQPRYMLGMVALRVGRALVPFGLLWIAKLIIESVEESYIGTTPVDLQRLAILIGVEFAIAVGGEVLARASALLERLLGELFANRISVELMQQAARLDLAQLENPETYNHLERARRQVVKRVGLLSLFLEATQNALTIVMLTGALLLYVPWLLPLLALAVVPAFIGELRFANLAHALLHQHTPERRTLEYLRLIATSEEAAKEVKLFGLAGYLVNRYDAVATDLYDANRLLARKRAAVSASLAAVAALGYYGAYTVIIYLTVLRFVSPGGAFTIGVLTFLAGSFRQSRDLLQSLLLVLATIYEESLHVQDLFRFLRLEPKILSPPGAILVPRPIRHGIVFESVSFRYPGSHKWAVRDLDFTLKVGETVALVGENGAGKTTVVKLLTRLYNPDEGRILLDGVDLREYELDSLRNAIGVIFQDFVRYAFVFRENIAVGKIEERHNDIRIHDAARRSLADAIAGRLERGFDQQLGRRFEDGVELSGGEWQKVALARAYMRAAQVLVLDEPTASLDAKSEGDVFERFAELARSRLAILISHRFSTVRMADRILVLRDGQLVDQGRHQELMQRTGLYAELFSMQAAAYR